MLHDTGLGLCEPLGNRPYPEIHRVHDVRCFNNQSGEDGLKPYRSRLKIILDILTAINEESGKISKILLYANLSYDRLMKYLKELLEKELIEEKMGEYKLTEKGYKFLEELKRAEKLAEAFGFRF
ncbi:MAG: hypothetical protein DRN49_05575 [Thaumarchaeota archaeon]|nr:MAG: hypothetical protein DRN49_05575 [Nitrososphaerota archaeon]